jgi:hypothetical protein
MCSKFENAVEVVVEDTMDMGVEMPLPRPLGRYLLELVNLDAASDPNTKLRLHLVNRPAFRLGLNTDRKGRELHRGYVKVVD